MKNYDLCKLNVLYIVKILVELMKYKIWYELANINRHNKIERKRLVTSGYNWQRETD